MKIIGKGIILLALAAALFVPATTFARHGNEAERLLNGVLESVLDNALSPMSVLTPTERTRISNSAVDNGRRYGVRVNVYENSLPVANYELERLLLSSGSDLVLHISTERSGYRDMALIRYAYRYDRYDRYGDPIDRSVRFGEIRVDRSHLISRAASVIRNQARRIYERRPRYRDYRYRYDDGGYRR